MLALVFAFNDKRPGFDISYWLLNFIKIFIFVAIALTIHALSHKLIAKRYNCNSEHRIWQVKRIGFRKGAKFPLEVDLAILRFKLPLIKSIPLGIIVPLFFTLVSNGRLFFPAVEEFELSKEKTHRLGRKYIHLTDYEEAKIAVAGPLANILLAVIFKIINPSGIFNDFIFINYMIAIFHMIPFPHLDGIKIFFGSKPLYIFSLVFIIAFIVLIRSLGPIITLIVAAITAIIIGTIYYYYRIFK